MCVINLSRGTANSTPCQRTQPINALRACMAELDMMAAQDHAELREFLALQSGGVKPSLKGTSIINNI